MWNVFGAYVVLNVEDKIVMSFPEQVRENELVEVSNSESVYKRDINFFFILFVFSIIFLRSLGPVKVRGNLIWLLIFAGCVILTKWVVLHRLRLVFGSICIDSSRSTHTPESSSFVYIEPNCRCIAFRLLNFNTDMWRMVVVQKPANNRKNKVWSEENIRFNSKGILDLLITEAFVFICWHCFKNIDLHDDL
jgi:hypothetical protein